jgi:hypothetical protein
MIVKGHQQLDAARTVVTRAELREQLIELWAAVFERELRAELELQGSHANIAADTGEKPCKS